jgi:hypothetical protein
VPSVRFFGLQSFVCWLTCGLLGYPQPSPRSVSVSDEVLPTNRPLFLTNRVHSLVSAVLFEVPSLLLPATPFGEACPAMGFFPLRGIPGGVHSCERTPSLATIRPQAFTTSRRLAPPPALWACCIPLPRPGFSPFRGFSRLAAVLTHRQADSPMLLSGRPLTALGRLPQSADSASRLYSANRSVCRGRWLAFLSVAPLFGFSPPPGSGCSPWAQFPGSIRS